MTVRSLAEALQCMSVLLCMIVLCMLRYGWAVLRILCIIRIMTS